MKTRSYVLVLFAFILFSVGAGWLLGRFAPRSPPRKAPSAAALHEPPSAAGRFYSVDNADGGYRVIQVLSRSADSLDVRLYGNHFPSRPVSVDKSKLTLEPSDGYAGPGFDRLTVTLSMYAAWKPVPVATVDPRGPRLP